MDQLKIFISYTRDDQKIADALKTLFEKALGSAVDVFLDKTSINFGGDIKDKIVDGLQQADVLVALIAGGQPASALNWIGWEVGTFEAGWRTRPLPKEHSNTNIVGQVVVLCYDGTSLGPEFGNRPVELGIPTGTLPDPGTEDYDRRLRAAARSQPELLKLVQDMEKLVKDGKYEDFFKDREDGLDDLVTEFKVAAFEELKGRIIHESKPTKHVVIRFSGSAMQDDYLELPDKSTLSFSDQTSSVFGLGQDQRSLFRKVEKPPTHVARYETTWGQFKDALKGHRYGAYWLGVIERALFVAKKGYAAPDASLVLVAHNERLHRVVATTVTTFFNNESEVSLYLIEALQRPDRGEESTSTLLSGITIVCRFRFAFLELKSDFYPENFQSDIVAPQAKAKELLMELDYLRNEAIHAELEKPAMWLRFMDENRLKEMMRMWKDVDLKLRGACQGLIDLPREATADKVDALVGAVVDQLKRIREEVRPFNAELGQAIAREMEAVFKDNKYAWVGQKQGRETP